MEQQTKPTFAGFISLVKLEFNMPLQYGKIDNKCLVRWGESGAQYEYKCDSSTSKAIAKAKAMKQAAAIESQKNK